MKALLWKEYRQHRQLMVASAIILSAPYLVVLLVGLFATIKYGPQQPAAWEHNFAVSGAIALAACVLLAAFFGGNAIAGERGDRSAEFVAYLPISRSSTIVCKAIIAIGACVIMLTINSSVVTLCASALSTEPSVEYYPGGMVLATWIAAALVFSVAWGVSSVVTRPATAAATGLGALLILIFASLLIEEALGPKADQATPVWYTVSCLVFGATGITGTAYYLHRLEP